MSRTSFRLAQHGDDLRVELAQPVHAGRGQRGERDNDDTVRERNGRPWSHDRTHHAPSSLVADVDGPRTHSAPSRPAPASSRTRIVFSECTRSPARDAAAAT